jgi:transcriptional regulator with XRE-family HTH domain
LQQARLARGLSQQQVAAQLGISQAYVSELESGKESLALTRIFDLMRLTGMTMHAEIPEGPIDAKP